MGAILSLLSSSFERIFLAHEEEHLVSTDIYRSLGQNDGSTNVTTDNPGKNRIRSDVLKRFVQEGRAKHAAQWKTLIRLLPPAENKDEKQTKMAKAIHAVQQFEEIKSQIAFQERQLAWGSRLNLIKWIAKEASTSEGLHELLKTILDLLCEKTNGKGASIWKPGQPGYWKQSLRRSGRQGWSSLTPRCDNETSGSLLEVNNMRNLRSQDFAEEVFSSFRPTLLLAQDWPQLVMHDDIRGILVIPIIVIGQVHRVAMLDLSEIEFPDRPKLINYASVISSGLWSVVEAEVVERSIERAILHDIEINQMIR